MCGILEVLLAAPSVILLALMLYAVVDRDQVEETVGRKMNEWDNR